MGNLLPGRGLPLAADESDVERKSTIPLPIHARTALKTLDLGDKNRMLFAHDDEAAQAYHACRTRPFAFNDCGYPSAILVPRDTKDVAKILKVMSGLEGEIKLAVAGGCHGHVAMADDAIVVYLKDVNHVRIDDENMKIYAGGGCLLKDLDLACAKNGKQLGYVTGTNGDTGVGGLSLSGGIGYLSRKHGMAVDNILEAEIVLHDGRIIRANDDNEYKDLIRALRGGGGNFGIVTEFVFQLYDVEYAMGGAVVALCPTSASASQYLLNWAEWSINTPPEPFSVCVLLCGLPIIPALLAAVGDSVKNATDVDTQITDLRKIDYYNDLLALQGPWVRFGNDIRRRDYSTELQSMLEPMQKRGRYIQTSFFVPSMTKEVTDLLVHYARTDFPNRKCKVLIFSMGGKIAQPTRPHSTCFRENTHWVILEGEYTKDGEDEIVIDWLTRFKKALLDRSLGKQGQYAVFDVAGENEYFIGYDEIKKFLKSAKAKYDPKNMFKLNVNIKPEVAAVSGT